MATRAQRDSNEPKRVIYDVSPTDIEEPSALPDDEAAAFDAFRKESAESESYSKLTLWRQPSMPSGRRGQQKLSFLFECGIDEYSYSQLLSKLRDGYGSGTYRIHARDENGILIFNRSVTIEREANSPAPKDTMTEVISSVQAVLDAAQARFEVMLERLGGGQGAATGPAAMLEQMKAFAGMLGAMAPIFQGQQRGGGALDEIEKFIKLKSLIGELGGEGGGGSGAEANFYDLAGKLVDRFGPAFVTAVAAHKAPGGAAVPPALAAPSGAAVPQPAPAPTPQPEPQGMKNQVNALVRNAKNGIDPVTMAVTILDLTPDSKIDALYEFVAAPNCVERMAALDPEVQNYRDWFEALRAKIIEELRDDEESATVPPATP